MRPLGIIYSNNRVIPPRDNLSKQHFVTMTSGDGAGADSAQGDAVDRMIAQDVEDVDVGFDPPRLLLHPPLTEN